MKLGYTIDPVSDVAASLHFHERAFGLTRRFLHESGTYGELDTGATTLAFAAHELGDGNLPGGHARVDGSSRPLGMEIGGSPKTCQRPMLPRSQPEPPRWPRRPPNPGARWCCTCAPRTAA